MDSVLQALALGQTLCGFAPRACRDTTVGPLEIAFSMVSWTEPRTTPLQECLLGCFRASTGPLYRDCRGHAGPRPPGLMTGYPCPRSRFRQITGTREGLLSVPPCLPRPIGWRQSGWWFKSFWNTIGRERTWERRHQVSSL